MLLVAKLCQKQEGAQRLAKNGKGGRALLTALPLIFQTAQGSEPATLTSSHKPASLTFGTLLTSHFPP